MFDGLSPGYYEIKETKTPEGYVTTGTDCFYIRVNNNGVSLIQPDLSKPAEQWSVIGSSDMVYTFTAAQGETPATAYVGNTPGAELPHTGGIGTSHLYLTGGLMTLAAGLILYLKRKKSYLNNRIT